MSSWSLSSDLPSGEDSHLLSQSLPSPDPFDASSHIQTGPGGADLSISELSLSDKPDSRDGPRFSLLAPPPPPPLRFPAEQGAIIEGEENEEEGDTIVGRVAAAKTREDKLQDDLFILRKLNASFAVLNDALRATKGATEQVAEQLSQTDALLDKYANLLGKSEIVTRLIFDERWEGADADEVILVKEREEALEQARLEREREEVAIREAEERARREAEEAAQREVEERAKQEAAAAAAAFAAKPPTRGRPGAGAISSGVRGVRGTRATATAMMASRRTREVSKTASTSTSTISRTRSASAAGSVSSGGGGTRPSSVASRGSGLPRGAPRRG